DPGANRDEPLDCSRVDLGWLPRAELERSQRERVGDAAAGTRHRHPIYRPELVEESRTRRGELDLHRRLGRAERPQRARLAARQDSPLPQDGDLIGQALRLVEVVRTQDETSPGVLQPEDHLANGPRAERVQAGGW